MATLFCLKQNKKYTIRSGLELLQAYKINLELPLQFGCCKGQCGVCAIKVIEGQSHLSRMTKQEIETLKQKNLDSSYRLACQCAIQGDVTIDA